MKKALITSLALVGLGVYSFWFSGRLIKKENPEQLVKKENQTVVTESYSSSGAIAGAKALSEGKSFRVNFRWRRDM